MNVAWNGITRLETLTDEAATASMALADAARQHRWSDVLRIVTEHPEWVNACRLGGRSLYAPLHQAAHGGAPVAVAEQLVELGAWRTLQNARGERPIDVAERRGHHELLAVLEPIYRHRVPLGVLGRIQAHLHELIRARADGLERSMPYGLPN